MEFYKNTNTTIVAYFGIGLIEMMPFWNKYLMNMIIQLNATTLYYKLFVQ